MCIRDSLQRALYRAARHRAGHHADLLHLGRRCFGGRGQDHGRACPRAEGDGHWAGGGAGVSGRLQRAPAQDQGVAARMGNRPWMRNRSRPSMSFRSSTSCSCCWRWC